MEKSVGAAEHCVRNGLKQGGFLHQYVLSIPFPFCVAVPTSEHVRLKLSCQALHFQSDLAVAANQEKKAQS